MEEEKFWGWLLAAWSFIAIFVLGVLDLEPQIREAGGHEPSFLGQVVGLAVFFILLKKYMLAKGWWN